MSYLLFGAMCVVVFSPGCDSTDDCHGNFFYRTKSTKSCVRQGDQSKGVMSRSVGGRGVPVSSITDPLCEVDLCGLCWFGSLI